MEFEAWWLLALPLFFALGWMAGRRDVRQAAPDSAAPSPAYLHGLTHLLNEQYDHAIASFVDVMRVEPEVVELHFALGALFRRRGESDRAIRVHQNLVDRTDLTDAQRNQARFELGLDFLKAGLIDRAEAAFNRLDGTPFAEAAARQRLEIAQKSRDWPHAIELARQPGTTGDTRPDTVVAQAWCEIAEQALRARRTDEASQAARQAWAAAPDHPRPVLLLGRIALGAGAPADALRSFEHLADRNPEYVSLVVADWVKAAAAVDEARADGADTALRQAAYRIRDAAQATGSADILRAIAPTLARLDGEVATAEWLRAQLAGQSSLVGLLALLDLSPSLKADPDAEALRQILQRDADRLARYVCGHCGFRAQAYPWHCPGCAAWDSYVPRRIESVDAGV